jgi:hypothetical protein
VRHLVYIGFVITKNHMRVKGRILLFESVAKKRKHILVRGHNLMFGSGCQSRGMSSCNELSFARVAFFMHVSVCVWLWALCPVCVWLWALCPVPIPVRAQSSTHCTNSVPIPVRDSLHYLTYICFILLLGIQGQGLTLWHVGVLISVLVCGWLFDRCSGWGQRERARGTGEQSDRESRRD